MIAFLRNAKLTFQETFYSSVAETYGNVMVQTLANVYLSFWSFVVIDSQLRTHIHLIMNCISRLHFVPNGHTPQKNNCAFVNRIVLY